MRFPKHLVLRAVEGAGETAVQLPVEHVHGLARPQAAAGFEQVDGLFSKQAGHLDVQHAETKGIPVRGASLREERVNVSEELAERAN
ncbi:MAG: hypothetical protein JRG67_14985 [Deltaproteobacteria bacterium]|nr:hypothetical protein [Deltaproteobacteria bacterium]